MDEISFKPETIDDAKQSLILAAKELRELRRYQADTGPVVTYRKGTTIKSKECANDSEAEQFAALQEGILRVWPRTEGKALVL